MSPDEKLLRQAALWLPLLAELAGVDPDETAVSVKAVMKDQSERELTEMRLADTIGEIRLLISERDALAAEAKL